MMMMMMATMMAMKEGVASPASERVVEVETQSSEDGVQPASCEAYVRLLGRMGQRWRKTAAHGLQKS